MVAATAARSLTTANGAPVIHARTPRSPFCFQKAYGSVIIGSPSRKVSLMQCKIFRMLILSLALLLAGCNPATLVEKFASPEEQAVAKQYIALLRAKQYQPIEEAAHPDIAGASLRATLVEMNNAFPAGEPTSTTLVGAYRTYAADESETVNLTYEYGFGEKWLLTNVAVNRKGDKTAIVGFSVIPQPTSLAEQNRFSLAGKTWVQYAVFATALACLMLTLYALALCIRTRLAGRKWPWILFILVGFGKLAVNWSTGEWAFLPLSVQAFSASATAPVYGAWTVAVSVPVGALVFLALRKRLGAPVISPITGP